MGNPLRRLTALLRWAAVEGQLHPWRRGAVLGGLFAVVWTALILVWVGWSMAHSAEWEARFQARVGLQFGQAALLIGFAGCVWVPSRSVHSLWRLVCGWFATCAGLVIASVVGAVVLMLAEWQLEKNAGIRLNPSVESTCENWFGHLDWLVPVALGQIFVCRAIRRGERGPRFRRWALLAAGMVALHSVFPTVLMPPFFIRYDFAESYPVFLNFSFVDVGAVQLLGFIAAVLWSVLWLRHGYRWWGGFGGSIVGMVVLVTAAMVARHLYALPVEAHADDVARYLPGLLGALLAASPFLWIARIGDRATAVPYDHPSRDAALD